MHRCKMAAKQAVSMMDNEQTKTKHPSYSVMIEETLVEINNRQGSSRQAVMKHMAEKFHLDSATYSSHATKALKACLEKKVIESSTGDLKGKLKLTKERKDELKKIAKKAEKKVEKVATEQSEKVVTKPPKKPSEKRHASKSADKENVPTANRKTVIEEGEELTEKDGTTKAKKAKTAAKTIKKSASASKIDEMKMEEQPASKAKGRRKGSANADTEEDDESKKKPPLKKGAKKKTAD